jgi:hypothetical protein
MMIQPSLSSVEMLDGVPRGVQATQTSAPAEVSAVHANIRKGYENVVPGQGFFCFFCSSFLMEDDDDMGMTARPKTSRPTTASGAVRPGTARLLTSSTPRPFSGGLQRPLSARANSARTATAHSNSSRMASIDDDPKAENDAGSELTHAGVVFSGNPLKALKARKQVMTSVCAVAVPNVSDHEGGRGEQRCRSGRTP